MKSSMDMPNQGFWKALLISGAVSLTVKDRARIAGVSTIQQPPGAGTPRKKFFQYGMVGCSSIVLKRARRKASQSA